MEPKFHAHSAMISVAFNTGHHFGVNDGLEVMLVNKDVVK